MSLLGAAKYSSLERRVAPRVYCAWLFLAFRQFEARVSLLTTHGRVMKSPGGINIASTLQYADQHSWSFPSAQWANCSDSARSPDRQGLLIDERYLVECQSLGLTRCPFQLQIDWALRNHAQLSGNIVVFALGLHKGQLYIFVEQSAFQWSNGYICNTFIPTIEMLALAYSSWFPRNIIFQLQSQMSCW